MVCFTRSLYWLDWFERSRIRAARVSDIFSPFHQGDLLKKAIRSALLRGVRLLPPAARRLILMDAPTRKNGYQELTRLAREAGIVGFVVDGEFGRVQGSSQDRVVMRSYARDGSWAKESMKSFSEFFRGRGGTYLDIGGNIGLTTIPVARNANVQCFTFEPEPSLFRFLSANVACNCPHANVRLINCALFDRESRLAFELSPNNRATTGSGRRPEVLREWTRSRER